ncbi:MAG: NADH dehydrogenase FAD-containing subunit, partial [Planctomycetes bacterium]|nr:NADH dehydrogenase FAD-containing subunit [Planctomycetota bacterium]
MVVALFLVPALAGIAAFFIRPHGPRRALLTAVAVAHASLTGLAWLGLPAPALQGLLKLDELGLLFLSITSALFLVASFYAVGYLERETPDRRPDFEQ